MLRPVLSILLLIGLGVVPTQHTGKKIILPPGSNAAANFSPGMMVDGTLYISGQGGEDANGKIPADFEAEVKQCLDNIGVVLKEAGMSPADVVGIQVYLTDKETFQRMNTVYASYFKVPRPARTTVVVAGLVGPGRIEITATARK